MDVQPFRILFIITDLDTGGAEMMLLRLLQMINRSQFDCHVINLSETGLIGEKIRDLGIPVNDIGLSSRWINPLRLLDLFRLIRKEKPKLVQTWMYHADMLGGLAAWISSIPVIWNIHNFTLHPKSKWTTKMVVKMNAFFSGFVPDKIITCSKAARDFHIQNGYKDNKFQVIPNGIDISSFQPDPQAASSIRKEFRITPSEKIVGHVARFDPQKDHAMLIEAARIVITEIPEVQFILCGENITSENTTLMEWINKAGISNHIHLTGRRDDISHLMSGFDLLVSSSVGEAFPVVLGEAMASGVLCVATDVGDSAFILGDTGRIVPPGSPEQLADAMKVLLTLSYSERQALSIKARQRIIDCFNITDIVKQYETCYRDFLRSF